MHTCIKCIKYLFKFIHDIFPHNTNLHFYLVISGIIVEVPRNRWKWRFVYK